MIRHLLPLAAVAVIGLFAASAVTAAPFSFWHDDVVGTSLEITLEADDATAAATAERAALAEIDRLAAVCSTYDPTSEVSRWLAAGVSREVSPELAAILRACDRWRDASGGCFHPGVAGATQLWRVAERTGVAVAGDRLAAAAVELRDPPWIWTGTAVAPRAALITLDGLAKGAIVDAAVG